MARMIEWILDRWFLLKFLWKKFGVRAVIKQFRLPYARPISRSWIKQYAPSGLGLEIGVGAQTIAPIYRTKLSDAFKSHAKDASLAAEFFPADCIPYADQSFQFLLSEHVLEHVPNVIQTLKEWRRVLKERGMLFLFLPHPDRTFDQGRTLTTLAHLQDEESDWSKNEAIHYEEWQKQVIQQGRATHYASLNQQQCLTTHSLHRHVWNEQTMSELLQSLGFQIVMAHSQVKDREDSFVVIAQKNNCEN